MHPVNKDDVSLNCSQFAKSTLWHHYHHKSFLAKVTGLFTVQPQVTPSILIGVP